MSSLWTPGGEVPVGKSSPEPEPTPPPQPTADTAPSFEDLSPEDQARLEEAAAEVADIRQQLAEAPPDVVVANHVMGLYELAAVHLSVQPPNLPAAQLAIDALGAVMDACQGRLGEHESELAGARSQLQMAFVQVAQGDAPADAD